MFWFGVVLLVRFPSKIAPQWNSRRHRGTNHLQEKEKRMARLASDRLLARANEEILPSRATTNLKPAAMAAISLPPAPRPGTFDRGSLGHSVDPPPLSQQLRDEMRSFHFLHDLSDPYETHGSSVGFAIRDFGLVRGFFPTRIWLRRWCERCGSRWL